MKVKKLTEEKNIHKQGFKDFFVEFCFAIILVIMYPYFYVWEKSVGMRIAWCKFMEGKK